jgi:hypothetical protein
MSDTPQNDEVTSELASTENVTNDSVVASETTSQVQAESKEQVEIVVDEAELAKQKSNDAFNKQYGEKKQLERDLALAKEQNSKFEQAERERQAAQVGDIPAMPDAFDDDFDAKVKVRDDALVAQANYNATNQAYLNQQQQTQQQAALAKQQAGQKVLQEHNSRVKELGIKPEAMMAAENTVMNYGMSNELLTHIAGMTDSPLVINHLAANPVEGYELANMAISNPYGVSAYLSGIAEKASALKPKTSSTPAPATNLEGNGVDPEAGKYQYIVGATFE